MRRYNELNERKESSLEKTKTEEKSITQENDSKDKPEIVKNSKLKLDYLNADNFKSIFILSNSNFSLALPFNVFPEGNFNLCELTFLPFTITS